MKPIYVFKYRCTPHSDYAELRPTYPIYYATASETLAKIVRKYMGCELYTGILIEHPHPMVGDKLIYDSIDYVSEHVVYVEDDQTVEWIDMDPRFQEDIEWYINDKLEELGGAPSADESETPSEARQAKRQVRTKVKRQVKRQVRTPSVSEGEARQVPSDT